MNIRDLRYAVAVAERRHFGRAAADCHVSQPALSGQIRKLEEQLGVALFERTKRSVRTTPVGEEIVAHARDLLKLVGLIEETAKARIDPLSGPLRLGMIPTIGPYLTPLLLPSIPRGLPKIELQLSEDVTESLERRLVEGEIDAALLATPAGDSRLAEIPLYDEPFWVALPQRHPMAYREDVDVADIRHDELLLLADGHCLRDQVLSFCSKAFRNRPAVSTQNTSLTTILALVGAGAGITLVPAMSLGGAWMTDSGIAFQKETSGTACRSVRLAYRKSFPRRAVLEKLADIICAILPDTVSPERR
jgi:LysR family hydrogen peroxide-inducible transcriptional activator